MNEIITTTNELVKDISVLIDNAKSRVAIKANAEMTMLYWHIGKRIQEEILKSIRAEYGQEVIKTLAKSLLSLYGRGFSRTALIRMNQFYQAFKEQQISATLSHQLSWSHIIELLPLKEQNQKDFYAYMSIQERWSVRQLRSNIDKMLYERTKLSQKSSDEQAISLLKINPQLEPDLILKDPYLLDFLELPDEYYESDLENAILQRIEQFILD